MKLLINVGGKGTRMGELTRDVPKPMILLNGKPILEYLIEWAIHSGFHEVLLLGGYHHHVIQDYFEDGYKFGIRISYSIEPKPLGSGGPIKYAAPFIDDTFAYISGDLFCDVDFKRFYRKHKRNKPIMSVVLHNSSHPEDSDILKLDNDNFVEQFISKHDDHTNAGTLGNAGLCIMEPEILDYMEDDIFNFENYIYPKLLADDEKIYGYVTEEIIHDIGTVERLKAMEKHLKAIIKNKN